MYHNCRNESILFFVLKNKDSLFYLNNQDFLNGYVSTVIFQPGKDIFPTDEHGKLQYANIYYMDTWKVK